MTVVVGTAGHIDHGKTALLRALTGIDADRLPEEQRRGMTIDVGYAWLALPDGTTLDFVDVPGHDRLVGNMLVGAGEIDAAMLVVAADDGPRSQTLEHLQLLDALAIAHGVAVVTKADLVDTRRVEEVADEVRVLLAPTALSASPVLAVSSVTGQGLDELRAALAALRDRVLADAGPPRGGARLAVDRVFAPHGRGVVVTGSLRGGRVDAGTTLRLAPGDRDVRVREVQVHGSPVAGALPGRTALNLAGVDAAAVARGMVLATGPAVAATDRLLVTLRPVTGGPVLPAHGMRLRLHLGTDEVGAFVARGRRDGVALDAGAVTAVLRLERPVAAAVGDRFVLRRPSPAAAVAGGSVLDLAPPRGVSRRRASRERHAALAASVAGRDAPGAVAAAIALHGSLSVERVDGISAALGLSPAGHGGLATSGGHALATDVAATVAEATIARVRGYHDGHPLEPGIPVAVLRADAAATLRRIATIGRDAATGVAAGIVDATIAAGRLVRHADRVALPGRPVSLPPEVERAMDRLVAILDAPMPPSLDDAARAAACPPEGVRALLSSGRIVRVSNDVTLVADAYHAIEMRAIELARDAPLTPAALRDALGSSRKYVVAILEDLDRRGILRRTPDGHVPAHATASAGGDR